MNFRKLICLFTLFTVFANSAYAGINIVRSNGITLTGADGITLTGADGITLTGADGHTVNQTTGLQSVDAELAIKLNEITDDSHVNAVLVFHQYPTPSDLYQLQQIGINTGTLYRVLPMIMTTATRQQIIAASRLPNIRSIYGNRTLSFDSDPFFNKTSVQRVPTDQDLQTRNLGMPVSGRNVTVAVLDTGVNSGHADLAGKVVQNVRLVDTQSGGIGFQNPIPVENLQNTDLASGHGTFVAGVIAASGVSSGGRYNGIAPGANILGLSAGDANLTHVLAGFDYILERGGYYNVRVVNCSFSANTVYDANDPVNIATKMLTERNVNVVFSAGNSGSGNGTLNPYAAAPWVTSVGATDEKSNLAKFSSRGIFGNAIQNPSLVAPGVNIVSLRSIASQTGTLGVASADTQRLTPAEMPFYTTASGTSFSAPMVAGTIALMLEANPNLSPKQIKEILQRSATPIASNYRHEVGAGMVNAYAAVLESAFPNRQTGLFRSVLENNAVEFSTSVVKMFDKTTLPGTNSTTEFTLPENTVQATVNISWGLSPNDLGLKVKDSNGQLIGESNNLNLTGLNGRREKVNLYNQGGRLFQAVISHTANMGTAQNYFGAVEISKVSFSNLHDINNLTGDSRNAVLDSLQKFVMLPQGKVFRPNSSVSRAELAAAILRSGSVSQFTAKTPMYTDVRDAYTRNIVESVQSAPNGRLIYDAAAQFRPDNAATRLVSAIAFVKSAGLENTPVALSTTISDYAQIPAEYRSIVAVALQKGFLRLENNRINPNASLSRLELAQAMNKIIYLEK